MTYLYKSRPALFAFLLFCVASSKHIIIYNEELLVAGTFFAFVVFITVYFGDTIKASLDESRNAILQELQGLWVYKKNGALYLKTQHEKVPAILESLDSIQAFTLECVSQIGAIATKSYNRTAHQQIQHRCEQYAASAQPLFTSYQQTMADSYLPLVLVNSQKPEAGGLAKQDSNGIANTRKTAKKGIELLQKAKA